LRQQTLGFDSGAARGEPRGKPDLEWEGEGGGSSSNGICLYTT
jgi:hypothetical protein